MFLMTPIKQVIVFKKSIIQIQRSFNLQLFDILYILVFMPISLIHVCNMAIVESIAYLLHVSPHVPTGFSTQSKIYIAMKHLDWFFSRHTTNFAAGSTSNGCYAGSALDRGSYCGQPNGLALSKHHGSVFYLTASSSMFLLFFIFCYFFLCSCEFSVNTMSLLFLYTYHCLLFQPTFHSVYVCK